MDVGFVPWAGGSLFQPNGLACDHSRHGPGVELG